MYLCKQSAGPQTLSEHRLTSCSVNLIGTDVWQYSKRVTAPQLV